MNWHRALALFGLLVLAVGLSGCGESWSWKQKITVEVETPEGVKRASSVIRYGLEHTEGWYVPPEARGAAHYYSGEAVVLEVSPGRYLFALLKGTPSPFPIFFPGEAPVKIASRFESLRAARTVPPKLYPLLVTFGDVTDPTSVQRVDPADLAATFGPGVRLKAITLEITDEPVTEGKVESVLSRSLFQRWASINRQALERNGIKDPYFRTFASNVSRDQFVNR
ncbi:hypothetical protein [Magnetospirillum aberrantis]|uniref:Uncharacterized protein n=1 Tax=Magnetospirillum aberrantis SpK TaxID=908842 RepID=A0A7C9UYB8_9PROT|nr:hypothetical protein [Magnetospirillum aberrantis]NFV79474.1 hypothetical protein [Magnetospirillum aberrantis SpK]